MSARRALVAALVLSCACADLHLESLRFRCSSDADCIRGTTCDPLSSTCGETAADPCALCGVRGCHQGRCSAIEQLALGGHHSCALLETGEVLCWGDNQFGQLGDRRASGNSSSKPVKVGALSGVVEIGAGLQHTCARLDSGDVECWGLNDHGQLGSAAGERFIAEPAGVTLAGAQSLAIGRWESSCALRAGGEVWCWGRRIDTAIPPLDESFDPLPVRFPGPFPGTPTAIGAGSYHACALLDGGAGAACWGFNDHGQLGIGTATSTSIPQRIALGPQATALGLGDLHGCAIDRDGAKCWGNSFTVLGDGRITDGRTLRPFHLTFDAPVLAISGGYRHTCALLSPGGVVCRGSAPSPAEAVPLVVIDGTVDAATLSVGFAHNCIVTTGGDVRCWGPNLSGELGTGDTRDREVATSVVF